MNTPAHALLAVAGLAGGARRPFARYALFGAVLPDLPMFGFYFWQRAVVGLPESQIWREAYFRTDWQLLFDCFNSIPLILLGWILAALASPQLRQSIRVLFEAMLLHVALDLPLHHDDAHRHFLPLSSWRFESPISYWDPAHGGVFGAGFEVACVLASAAILWRRYEGPWIRGMLVFCSGLSLAVYLVFYFWLRG